MSIVAKKIMMGSGAVALPSDDEFNRTSFLSHFDGTNNGVNNQFTDGSASNHTVTANGNVTQGSFGPFARPDGEWGVSFDGDGDSLTFTNDATMSLDGDYTFELFFNAKAIVIDTQHPNTFLSGTTQLFIHASDRYVSWYAGGADIVKSADNAILTNVWNHIAVVRSGSGSNNTSLYLNGTRVAQAQNTATLGASSGTARIGSYSASGGNFDGHISNIRILKGTALYSGTSITVPTSKLTAVSNTKLLTCQSNRFVDNSSTGFAITPAGNTAVTAFGPFLTDAVYDAAVNGASSIGGTSGNNYISAATSTDWQFGAGNFTVEFWTYPLATGSWVIAHGVGDVAGSAISWQYGYGTFDFYFGSSGGDAEQITSPTLTLNSWQYITVVRNGATLTVYKNGVATGTANCGTKTLNTGGTAPFYVGAYPNAAGGNINGYLSDVRVVKGTAVYTSNFTPPTAPLAAITNTKLLLNMADGQAFDSAAHGIITLAGNANVSTDQAKFGDTSLHTDGSGDAAFVKFTNAGELNFGTGDFTLECFVRFADTDNTQVLIANWESGANTWYLAHYGGSNKLTFYPNAREFAWDPSANTWYHMALTRASGVLKAFIDGTQIGSNISETANLAGANNYMSIGGAGNAGESLNGFFDEVRVSKFARYTSNFQAPTEPFPDKGQ